MFEKMRSRRQAAEASHAEAKAEKSFQEALKTWQASRDQAASLLATATSGGGDAEGLVLHRGEVCYGVLQSCSLVEERRGQGHYVGGSTGVSIPIGSLGGRSVRYRVGASRGHYVQGTPTPTAVATGTAYFTNQRIVFTSASQTRECAFSKLVGIEHDDQAGSMTISVSNRQHPTVLAYGPGIAPWVDFRVDVSLAAYRGDLDQIVAQLTDQLNALDAAKPIEPVESPRNQSS
jgi:hypothetical protein